jgi:hypothetical protein
MARTYTPEELAAVAKQTATEVGCEAVQWWLDERDPHHLYLKATHALLSGQAITVRLMTALPEGPPPDPRGSES